MSDTFIITQTDGEWHGLHEGRPEPLPTVIAMLEITFHAWCQMEGFAPRCAEEMLHVYSDDLSEAQEAWLHAFVALWDASTKCEG
jgi:hypothetical protein